MFSDLSCWIWKDLTPIENVGKHFLRKICSEKGDLCIGKLHLHDLVTQLVTKVFTF